MQAEGSLPRLSQVVARLEQRGWVRRTPDTADGRYTLAILTGQGLAKVTEAAPGHVQEVRRLVFDPLTKTSPGSCARSAGASSAPSTPTTTAPTTSRSPPPRPRRRPDDRRRGQPELVLPGPVPHIDVQSETVVAAAADGEFWAEEYSVRKSSARAASDLMTATGSERCDYCGGRPVVISVTGPGWTRTCLRHLPR